MLADGRRTPVRARFECFVYAHENAQMALMTQPAETRIEILKDGAVLEVIDKDSRKRRCW